MIVNGLESAWVSRIFLRMGEAVMKASRKRVRRGHVRTRMKDEWKRRICDLTRQKKKLLGEVRELEDAILQKRDQVARLTGDLAWLRACRVGRGLERVRLLCDLTRQKAQLDGEVKKLEDASKEKLRQISLIKEDLASLKEDLASLKEDLASLKVLG